MLQRIPFSKEVDLPYYAKNSRWHFLITEQGQVLKVANMGTKTLLQVDKLADIDAVTAQQLQESEECTPQEVQLQIELARENAYPIFFPVPPPPPKHKHFDPLKLTHDFLINLVMPHHQ